MLCELRDITCTEVRARSNTHHSRMQCQTIRYNAAVDSMRMTDAMTLMSWPWHADIVMIDRAQVAQCGVLFVNAHGILIRKIWQLSTMTGPLRIPWCLGLQADKRAQICLTTWERVNTPCAGVDKAGAELGLSERKGSIVGPEGPLPRARSMIQTGRNLKDSTTLHHFEL